MFECMYMPTPRLLLISGMIWILIYDWLIICDAFQFKFMAFSVVAINGIGPNNEMCC